MNTIVNAVDGGAPPLVRQASSFRVLVVEDEPFILMLNVKVLRRAGYVVDASADGLEGWEAFCARDYDLLITDLNMPRMTGWELIERVRCVRKDLPIILATGAFLDESIVQNAYFKSVSLLQKPFMNTQLLDRTKQVLGWGAPFAATS